MPEEKIFKDDELVNMIDPILATDDKNGDGYIDYKEFVLAQQAAATQKDVWNPFFPQKNPSKILKTKNPQRSRITPKS